MVAKQLTYGPNYIILALYYDNSISWTFDVYFSIFLAKDSLPSSHFMNLHTNATGPLTPNPTAGRFSRTSQPRQILLLSSPTTKPKLPPHQSG
jgi:hypothetical protein